MVVIIPFQRTIQRLALYEAMDLLVGEKPLSEVGLRTMGYSSGGVISLVATFFFHFDL